MRKKPNKWILRRKNIITPPEFGIIKKERLYHAFHKGELVRIKEFDGISYTCYKNLARQDVFVEDMQRLWLSQKS